MRFLNNVGGVFILLLLALGCKPEAKRSRVLVIQSFRWDDKNYLELNSDIRKELGKNRVNADIRTFYLDCECYMAEEEEERMYNFIDTIRLWKPDIILVNDDQATYTLMKCGHPFVKKVPVVFSGVNFPNWDLLEEYPNVTGSWDKIDYEENLRLIDRQMGKSRIYINYDKTSLGQLAFRELIKAVDTSRYVLDYNQLAFQLNDPDFKVDSMMFRTEMRMKAIRPSKNIIHFMPFRKANGEFLLSNINGTYPYCVFFNIRYDYTSAGLSKMFVTPSFTAVREIFNINVEVLGGYFCSNRIQAAEQARLAAKILSGTPVSSVPIVESPKEYLYDWVEMHLKPDQVSLAIGKGGLNIRLSKMLTGYDIDVYREVEEEDVDLNEFKDEIDAWIIDALKAVGCDTAKSVLELSVEEIASRADLEMEQAQKVVEILKAEFE